MNKTAFALLTLLALSTAQLSGQNQTGKSDTTPSLAMPAKKIDIRLPDDATQPVLIFDSVGGFRMKQPEGFEPSPLLTIFPDGRIMTGRKSQLVNEVEGQMDLVELQKLLAFVVNDCRYFDINSEMIKSDLEANRAAKVMDAGTTVFEINLRDNKNRIEVYALPQVATKFNEVPSVAAMVAVASRCRQIIARTRLGSEEEANAILNAVNRSLAEKEKGAPAFTFENLQFAEQYADGKRVVSFVMPFEANRKKMMAYATFQMDTQGTETVRVDVAERPRKRTR